MAQEFLSQWLINENTFHSSTRFSLLSEEITHVAREIFNDLYTWESQLAENKAWHYGLHDKRRAKVFGGQLDC